MRIPLEHHHHREKHSAYPHKITIRRFRTFEVHTYQYTSRYTRYWPGASINIVSRLDVPWVFGKRQKKKNKTNNTSSRLRHSYTIIIIILHRVRPRVIIILYIMYNIAAVHNNIIISYFMRHLSDTVSRGNISENANIILYRTCLCVLATN